jgi:2-oxoglutarate ferredoxin oxidoreductase subunit alpha
VLKPDPQDVFTGAYYIDGDVASAYGAVAAGCKFLAGYPITPSTEAAEAFARLIPKAGGIFIQMEDELGSIAAVLGAAWAGKKAMTVTSGPGFSLMMETIGFGAVLETPFVIINIQRGGPSTGIPTRTGQADMMQARWGSHGDYEVITLSPASPQECFDFTIKAFNLAERYRAPVMLMADECVGHMMEKVVVPEAADIQVEPRRYYKGPAKSYSPFKPDRDLVPPMVKAGDGYKLFLTGLAHDEKGLPASGRKTTTKRLIDKIRANARDIIDMREDGVDDAEVIVVSYGITSRVAIKAVQRAREEGIKVGTLRLVTVWPFPDNKIASLAGKVKGFVVPEINYGQVVFEVQRCAHGEANVVLVPHGGGSVHDPDDILEAIRRLVREKVRHSGVVEYETKLSRMVFEKTCQ